MPISKEELEEMLNVKASVEKVTTISFDGKNHLTRIPKKIIEELKLQKGTQLRWLVDSQSKALKIEVIK